MAIDYKLCPSKDFPWFITDPMGEDRYYRSEKDMLKGQRDVIEDYCDGEWSEEVEYIKAGKITHICVQCDRKDRPDEKELDKEGCSDDGINWNGIDFYCDYKLEKI